MGSLPPARLPERRTAERRTAREQQPRRRKRSKPLPAKALLAARGFNQRQFARYAGVSKRWVWSVLNGHDPAPEHFRHQLAAFLSIDHDVLWPDHADRDDDVA